MLLLNNDVAYLPTLLCTFLLFFCGVQQHDDQVAAFLPSWRYQQRVHVALSVVVVDTSSSSNGNDGDDVVDDDDRHLLEWQALEGGCQLLVTTVTPKAIVHFLGGAFVSPQPTVAYRYVLEQLAKKDYAIIATPFAVDFNYRKPAADIKGKFSKACRELELAQDSENGNDNDDRVRITNFSSLPQLAMGHSLGALMHVLLDCEYAKENGDDDDGTLSTTISSTRGAALISYNNKNVEGAIPGFKEVFVPAFSPLEPLTRDPKVTDTLQRVQELRRTGFDTIRNIATMAPGVKPLVLKAIDDAEAAAELVDQLPGVVASIANGSTEFEPNPEEMRRLVVDKYTQASPLIVRFTNDPIDESDILASILPKSLKIKQRDLPGTHLTPLAIDPNSDSTPLLPIPETFANSPFGDIRQDLLLTNADALVSILDDYFTESIQKVRDV